MRIFSRIGPNLRSFSSPKPKSHFFFSGQIAVYRMFSFFSSPVLHVVECVRPVLAQRTASQ